jgi:DNA excision repair protein ERCC-3
MYYRLIVEYHFRNDTQKQNINIELKPAALDLLRRYQKDCLLKTFAHDRAHSGLICLPCVAGRSLVGVAACCKVHKMALILCSSELVVEYWKPQFKMWSIADNCNS